MENEIIKRKKGRPKKIKTDENSSKQDKKNEKVNEINITNKTEINTTNKNEINTIVDKNNNVEEMNTIVVAKKKRGRKKKPVVEEVKQKKKRGRKAALKYFSSSIRKQIPLTTVMHNNNYILHLDVKEEHENNKTDLLELPGIEKDNNKSPPEFVNEINEKHETQETHVEETHVQQTHVQEIHEMLKNDEDILSDYLDNCEIKNEENLRELYEKRIQNREKQDKILFEKLENIHNDEELLTKMTQMINNKSVNSNNKEHANINTENLQENQDTQAINRKKGYFQILHKYVHNESWLYNTDVSCWWCCHTFNTIPLGLPEDYDIKTRKFRVKGIFCSFPCILAYNNSTRIKSGYKKYLIKHLYSRITGNSINTFIKSAPHRCCLKKFGGDMTIEEFRAVSQDNSKIYKLVEYPMYVSKDYIEEVDLINVKNANIKLFSSNNNNNCVNERFDQKKIQDAKTRLEESVVITGNNTIDKFIL